MFCALHSSTDTPRAGRKRLQPLALLTLALTMTLLLAGLAGPQGSAAQPLTALNMAEAELGVLETIPTWDPEANLAPASNPNLAIPDQLPAAPGAFVAVPVSYTANGNDISSLIFSVDLDENWLNFDPTDDNGDGIPDAVALNLPTGFNASVSYDANDTDGELDFFLGDTFPPLTGLPDSMPATITFTAGEPCPPTEAPVGFSGDPAPSFGNTVGQSIPGTWDDGSVLVGGRCDFNQDGTVDVLDIQMIADCWSEPIGGTCDARYDLDDDGDIDILDLQRVASAFMS